MHVITVTFVVHEQHVNEFHVAMLAQARNSLERESGCRQFDVCVDGKDRSTIFLYEIYDDETAFRAHLESGHFKSFDATVTPWVKDKVVHAWRRISPGG